MWVSEGLRCRGEGRQLASECLSCDCGRGALLLCRLRRGRGGGGRGAACCWE